MLAGIEGESRKICSTLTPNLSQEWKAFYAMNEQITKVYCWP